MEKLPQLFLYHPDLRDLPQPPVLPQSYSLRGYQVGDGQAWDAIIQEAFGWDAQWMVQNPTAWRLDFAALKRDAAFQPERVRFALCGQEPVATACAWHRPEYGSDCGYLHMVGAKGKSAGQGLGYAVVLDALYQMRREGRLAAILSTDDFRLPAIAIYRKLGFQIQMTHPSFLRAGNPCCARSAGPRIDGGGGGGEAAGE